MTPFEKFLEARGFHADACKATVDPDFYRMTECLFKTLVEIGDQGFGSIPRKPPLPTAFLKGQAARNAIT